MSRKTSRRIAIFGATGSIGLQTLDVISRIGGFDVAVLSADSKWEELANLAIKWRPEVVTLNKGAHYKDLKNSLSGSGVKVDIGSHAVAKAAAEVDFDICVNGLVGVAGLKPSYLTLQRGIDLALANKESLVLAGDLIKRTARETGAQLLPIDSEHSAIQQCLAGEEINEVRRLIITASGGPFREWSLEKIADATPEQALNHPTWKMCPKITVDSATLMNKGLEVIEAYFLFGLPLEKIEVLIHPVSIIHSMVEFVDGSIKAQLGTPDMRMPIQYALTYPRRLTSDIPLADPVDWQAIQFFSVDKERYPCLDLAFRALKMGGTATAALNGADEKAVELFLGNNIKFGDISQVIGEALKAFSPTPADSVETVLNADTWGREFVQRYCFNNLPGKNPEL